MKARYPDTVLLITFGYGAKFRCEFDLHIGWRNLQAVPTIHAVKKPEAAAQVAPSVPIPKFVSICGTLGTNFGIERTLANL